MRNIIEEKINAISNDFQSKFSIIDDNTISNMFSRNEVRKVDSIIKKHLGNVKTLFKKTDEVGDDYDLWLITINKNPHVID